MLLLIAYSTQDGATSRLHRRWNAGRCLQPCDGSYKHGAEALFAVGFSNERAESEILLSKFNNMIRAHLARFGYPLPPQNNEEALCNRAAMIFLTMKREADPDTRKSPTYVPTTGIKQTKAMEYAGYPDEAIHGKSAEYAKVTRRYKKLQL